MPFTYNGVLVNTLKFNGVLVNTLKSKGTTIWPVDTGKPPVLNGTISAKWIYPVFIYPRDSSPGRTVSNFVNVSRYFTEHGSDIKSYERTNWSHDGKNSGYISQNIPNVTADGVVQFSHQCKVTRVVKNAQEWVKIDIRAVSNAGKSGWLTVRSRVHLEIVSGEQPL